MAFTSSLQKPLHVPLIDSAPPLHDWDENAIAIPPKSTPHRSILRIFVSPHLKGL
jgi:hypothetical protein